MIALVLVVGISLGYLARWHEEHAARMRRERTYYDNVIPLRPGKSA